MNGELDKLLLIILHKRQVLAHEIIHENQLGHLMQSSGFGDLLISR